MIIRLSQKLASKLKLGTLQSMPPDENPYADWSAHLFTADRTQYIILTNTQSLYSVVMYGKGIADDSRFIERALDNIREFMEGDGQAFAYQRFIAPASSSVKFGKALNRSVTGSMNDLIKFAKHGLIQRELSPYDVGFNLNQIPISALRCQQPREAFKNLGGGGEAPCESAEPSQAPLEALQTESKANVPPGSAISVPFTYAQRKAVAEILPEIADRLKLDENKTRTIPFTSDELETIRQRAEAAIPTAENGMKRNSFRHIQTAMGWTNSHLHQFEIDGVIHGDPDLLFEGWQDEMPPIDSLNTRISQIVPKDGKRYSFRYEYDFGDDWQHEVLFEGCLRAVKGERYPLCVEGERACPPEDVGGIWGYAEFFEALADPEHDRHDEFVEWAGPFDSEKFDTEKATKAMRRGLPDWRRYR